MAFSKHRSCWRTTPCRKLPTLLLCPLTPTWWTWGRASSAEFVVTPEVCIHGRKGREHDGRRRARPDNPEGRGGPGGAVNVRRRGRLGRRPAARIRRRRRRLQLRGADAWERRRVQHEDLRRSLRDHRMCILVNVSVCVLAESSATSVHETMLRPALVRGFAGERRGGDVRLEGPRERGTHPRTRQCWCHGEARARDTRTSCKGQPG